MIVKRCGRCGLGKLPREFTKLHSTFTGLAYNCKPCQRHKHKDWRDKNPDRAKAVAKKAKLKNLYGLTHEEYRGLMDSQNGLCAICENPAKLGVDHCHKTGKVRGLLCFQCNVSIGNMNDDPAVLRRAAEYLESTSKS